MPVCYVLIGLPGSGKTTWANTHFSNIARLSTDDYVERFANKLQTTYSNCFKTVMPRAVRLMARKAKKVHKHQLDVVWDQTSLTELSRIRKFRMLPAHNMIAVVFSTPPDLLQRLASRPGKYISQTVLERMSSSYQEPSVSHGFSEIWRITT